MSILIIGAVAVLAGCGSSTDNASSGSTSPTTPSGASKDLGDATSSNDSGSNTGTGTGSSAAALPQDPCSLLTAPDVTSLLGSDAAGVAGPASTDPSGPMLTSCQWGNLADDIGQVSVAVSAPSGDAGIDYLGTLVAGSGLQGAPSSVGQDGQVYEAFIRPGGGGVGKSVRFTQNGLTVLVARSGASVDSPSLEAAAQQVSGRL